MVFDSTVRRELSRSFAATLVVILTIVLTMMLIRTLGQAAGGQVAPQDVVLLLGFTALGHLPTILALSLFVATVVTLGRMYRDSEMVVWFASGLSLRRFVAPVLQMAAPVLAVIAVLLLVVWPWGNRQSVELRDRYQQRSDLSRVAPGVFQSSSDGRRVFFVERTGDDAVIGRNVFILSREGEREALTSAQQGRLETQDDGRFLVLEKGFRQEADAATGEHLRAGFERYRILVGERDVRRAQALPPRATSTLALIADSGPRAQGELAWRLGLALAAINLTLMGIGLAATHPRRPSNWNLLFALLAFIVYYNLVNLTQAWVAGERMGLGAAMVLLHGGGFALALGLMAWREYGTVAFWRRRAAAGGALPA